MSNESVLVKVEGSVPVKKNRTLVCQQGPVWVTWKNNECILHTGQTLPVKTPACCFVSSLCENAVICISLPVKEAPSFTRRQIDLSFHKVLKDF